MARPLKEIDWDYVERQAMAGCKACEIYPEFGINDDTFYRRFKDYFGESFQDFAGRIHGVGKGKIKLTQFEKALEGNTAMLQLLGREWLGQQQEDTNKSVSPNEDLLHRDQRIAFLENEVRTLKENAQQPQAEPSVLRGMPPF